MGGVCIEKVEPYQLLTQAHDPVTQPTPFSPSLTLSLSPWAGRVNSGPGGRVPVGGSQGGS